MSNFTKIIIVFINLLSVLKAIESTETIKKTFLNTSDNDSFYKILPKTDGNLLVELFNANDLFKIELLGIDGVKIANTLKTYKKTNSIFYTVDLKKDKTYYIFIQPGFQKKTTDYEAVFTFFSHPQDEKAYMISVLKEKSCMFSSVLNNNIEEKETYINAILKSNCISLPRIVDTWMNVPDFTEIKKDIEYLRLNAMDERHFTFGIFIAEAININSNYVNKKNNQTFKFKEMCKENTLGKWGKNSCIPDISKNEYRQYLLQLFSEAIDSGVRDFLFGQIDLQDSTQYLKYFLEELYSIAQSKSAEIIIGGQTGWVSDPRYIGSFDYIVAPSRISKDGKFNSDKEDCFEAHKDIIANETQNEANQRARFFCQNLGWMPPFSKNAKNVIVEFDWWSIDDDIHRFARLSPQQRSIVLTTARNFFIDELNLGFIMPYRLPLNGGIDDGCFGFNQYVYSSLNNYNCKDEDTILELMK
ncbi:MAG: hypothetical protein H6622_06760 [Halobacteriovoraceae bacterium]|nr:hypothetical protein [Halobacteriovoraceae bacterium]